MKGVGLAGEMVFIHPLVIVDVAGQNQVGHAPGIAKGILGRVGHLRVPVKNVERRVNRGRRKTD